MTKTVLELDLVGYSTIAAALEDGLGVETGTKLNQQIQSFVDQGLTKAKVARDQVVMQQTGDGAILVFERPSQAHTLAAAVHAATQVHNAGKGQGIGKRVFRIGIATGDLVQEAKSGGGFEIAGMTITRAVRLEAKARPGEVVCDVATFAGLTTKQKALYSAPEAVSGKRAETFTVHRWLANLDGGKDAEFFTQGASRKPQPAPARARKKAQPTQTPAPLTPPQQKSSSAPPLPPPITPAKQAPAQPHDGLIAVLGRAKKVVGMGILIHQHYAVTCAHVVDTALGRVDADQERPSKPVQLIFPYSRTDGESDFLTAEIVGWYPVRPASSKRKGIHDVAVLKLEKAALGDISPATLDPTAPMPGNIFTTFRSSTGDETGTPADGKIGPLAENGTYHLRAMDFIGDFIDHGFSGAGCWDHVRKMTVGMVVTARRDATKRVANMIPSGALIRAIAEAQGHSPTGPPPPPPDNSEATKHLREAALKCLERCAEAVAILSKLLFGESGPGTDRRSPRVKCLEVVEALIKGDVVHVVDAMVQGYFQACDDPAKSCAPAAIERLCNHIMPIIYRPEDIQRVRAVLVGVGAFVVLPVTSPTSVEAIMAGAEKRPLAVREIKERNEPARGTHAMEDPPEDGMDEDGENFISQFRSYLASTLVLPQYRNHPNDKLDQYIKDEIQRQIKLYGKRYYYFYQAPELPEFRTRRSDLVARLMNLYSGIVFFCLEPDQDDRDEVAIAQSLNHLFSNIGKRRGAT